MSLPRSIIVQEQCRQWNDVECLEQRNSRNLATCTVKGKEQDDKVFLPEGSKVIFHQQKSHRLLHADHWLTLHGYECRSVHYTLSIFFEV